MNYNPDIYKDIQNTSKSALSFLRFRDKQIKDKDAELYEIESRLNMMKQSGMPTESEEKIFSAKEQELYNLEFDIDSIMTEQSYMDKLMFDVRDMLNVNVVTFGDSQKHIQKIKSDVESISKDVKAINEEIKNLSDNDPLKDELRMEVISKEDFLNKLLELENKINNKFSNFSSYESNRVSKLEKAKTEQAKLQKEIDESILSMDEAYSNFANIHKDVVDERLNLLEQENSLTEIDNIGEKFNVSGADVKENPKKVDLIKEELNKKAEEEVKKYDDYEHFLQHIETLRKQLQVQNDIIKYIEQDKEWLYGRIELKDKVIREKDAKIDELQIKLDAWDSSYKEFNDLVTALGNKVGFTEKYLNASGRNIDVDNPLGNLIERLERITKYVESEEYQQQVAQQYEVKTEKAINPALLGGIALGTIALSTLIKK
jgi:chromosome segregation ATPase